MTDLNTSTTLRDKNLPLTELTDKGPVVVIGRETAR